LAGRKPVLFVILVNFHAPGAGSAIPIRIRNRIHADPDPKHWFKATKSLEKNPTSQKVSILISLLQGVA
jgi:hypothetical protein